MQLADHGIIVRAKFTAKPGEQFLIRREAYRKIKLGFDQAGIQFAYPTVTINGGGAQAERPEVQAAAKLALGPGAPAAEMPVAS
jgi:small-conductance mechanosensitive channel